MKLVIQRTSGGKVEVGDSTVGEIGPGIMVLVGFGKEDTEDLPDSKVWNLLIDKMIGLRIFEDKEERMNLSLADIKGDVLIVSQFTLYASCKKDAVHPSQERLPLIWLNSFVRVLQPL